jgi:hypothetical protein
MEIERFLLASESQSEVTGMIILISFTPYSQEFHPTARRISKAASQSLF